MKKLLLKFTLLLCLITVKAFALTTPVDLSATVSANTFLAGPTAGSDVPQARLIVSADIPTLNQNTTGSAATLTTARTINGTSFNGSANITVTADANTLTNTTLHSTVTASSLTSVGSLTSADATTPQFITASGKTNTGKITINGKTNGSTIFTTDDSTNKNITITTAPQTGLTDSIITIPDLFSVSDTFTFVDKTQTLSNKTFVTANLGTPASGTLTNCTFPTLNQSTTGSAATLTTPRAINGTNFDGSAAITVTAAAGTLTDTTLAAGVVSSSLTTVGTLASPTLTTPVINGTITGTGQAVGSTVSTIVMRDTFANTRVNNLYLDYTTTATSGGTLTLTKGATYQQYFTGVTTHTCKLPDATSLNLGTQYQIVNNSTGAIAIQTSTAVAVTSLTASTSAVFTCISFASNAASSWSFQIIGAAPAGTLTGTTLASNVVTSSLTTVGTLASPTLTTPVINGTITGTGQATAATASTIAMRDSNANITANTFIPGFTSTATAAGTTTMVVGNTTLQYWTGTTTQTIKLPTTSVVSGQAWTIVNQSTGLVTVQSSGANTIQILPTGSSGTFTSIVATPTAAAGWQVLYSYLQQPERMVTKTAKYSVLTTDSNTHFRTTGAGAFAATNLVVTSFVCTVTATAHGLSTGQDVTLRLATSAVAAALDMNVGTFQITGTTANTFTFATIHANIATGAVTGSAISTTYILLPLASTTAVGFTITVENNDSTSYSSILGSSTDTISGQAVNTEFSAMLLTQKYAKMTLESNGVTDWSVISCNGENVSNNFQATAWTPASTTIGGVTGNFIILTPGEWDVSGNLFANAGSYSQGLGFIGAGGTATGTDSTGLIDGINDAYWSNNVAGATSGGTIASWRLVVTATELVAIKGRFTYTVAPSVWGRVSARRIR